MWWESVKTRVRESVKTRVWESVKNSSTGVGKDSGMVESIKARTLYLSGSHLISLHGMAWHVGFQHRIANLQLYCDVNVKIVKCKHCMCT